MCETLEGPVHYSTGDALLTGVEGETWPVPRERFHNSFAPEGALEFGTDGRYVRLNRHALAIQLTIRTEIAFGIAGDRLTGQAGDWLVGYEDGSFGIVADRIFRATYDSADLIAGRGA
jgi:hypothetical protein